MNAAPYSEPDNQRSPIAYPAAGYGGSFVHQAGKKMVCLDVDGTTVNHDGLMSEAVKHAGRAVVADGHTVVIATGRSLPATLPIIQTLGVTHGFAVCSNGGVTLRSETRRADEGRAEDGYEVIAQQVFDPAPALEALTGRLSTARYAIETSAGHFLSTERFEDLTFGLAPQPVSLKELKRAEAVRLVVNSSDATAGEFARTVEDIGLHGVTYSVGWSAWLDITAQGVTKASSLEQLRTQLGASREATVACGDGHNDIEVLRWARSE